VRFSAIDESDISSATKQASEITGYGLALQAKGCLLMCTLRSQDYVSDAHFRRGQGAARRANGRLAESNHCEDAASGFNETLPGCVARNERDDSQGLPPPKGGSAPAAYECGRFGALGRAAF